MLAQDGLSLCEGAEPLGLLVGAELEKRWSNGHTPLDWICHYSLVPTGKLFRPILLLHAAQAVGGDPAQVMPAAVGAECGHVASLIHDDIIDQDDLRRGRASVQHKYGVNDAIVAGDALIFDLFMALAECRQRGVSGSNVAAALEAVARAGLDLCRGQHLEAELTASRQYDAEMYLRVARLKTASFFRGACECGALLAGGSPDHVAALSLYGESLGTAFQIHDDLLAYLSRTQIMGKPDVSDVQNGRLTLPVILAHQAGTREDRRLISDALFTSMDPVRALALVTDIVERTGAVAEARRTAQTHVETAKSALRRLPASDSRDTLHCYAEAVISRDH
ncbi:MAG TPA: polyprenyl synthetase family protein [Streptosporangiaceae bacterium]